MNVSSLEESLISTLFDTQALMAGPASTSSGASPKDTASTKSTSSRRKFSFAQSVRSINGSSSIRNGSPKVRTSDAGSNGKLSIDTLKAARVRALSNSSGDLDMALETPVDHEPEASNPRKRMNGDAPDYPRRRATIACEICRGRKSRCDGAKPKCRLCSELNAECVYREPGIKLDAGDKLILERLNRIEGLLATSMISQPTKTLSLGPLSPPISSDTQDIMSRSNENLDRPLSIPVAGIGTWFNNGPQQNISVMPKVHTTPALHLLQWPMIRDLVSRSYDPQHLLQLELSREPLNVNVSGGLDLTNTAAYVQAFFEHANVWYAVVNPYNWNSCYRVALSHGFREGPESCITLLVLALGAASLGGSISRVPRDKDPPGMAYFAHAWQLMPSLMTRNNTLSSQCLILAAAYLFYLVRPMEAWNMLSQVSMKLQLLLCGQDRIPEHSKELSERVYWNTLLFESDLLAELDLPHSGIVQFEESVGLPGGFEEEEEDPAGRDELWYFLAEIALRRLLNRVSSVIYSKSARTDLEALDPIASELDFQLTQWYEGLPRALQFPYSRVPLSNPVQTVLRLRYFACRTIIFRPYILAVLENESAFQNMNIRENCHKCLEASVRQLEHITAHHAGHLPYLWQGALSIVSQTLLVMSATMSPRLSALLPPSDQMDAIISEVVAEVERYAHLAPSLRLSAEIVREAEERRMFHLRAAGMR